MEQKTVVNHEILVVMDNHGLYLYPLLFILREVDSLKGTVCEALEGKRHLYHIDKDINDYVRMEKDLKVRGEYLKKRMTHALNWDKCLW